MATYKYYYNKKTGEYITSDEYQNRIQNGAITPTSQAAVQDINPQPDLFQKVGDFAKRVFGALTKNEANLGQDIGYAISGGKGNIDKITQQYANNAQTFTDLAKKQTDPAKKKQYAQQAVDALKEGQQAGADLKGRTAEQIVGDVLGTTLDVATAAAPIGGPVKALGDVVAGSEQAVGTLPGIVKGLKTGATVGGILGAGYGTVQGLQNKQDIGGVATEALGGAITGGVAGGVVGGVVGGFQGRALQSEYMTAGEAPTEENNKIAQKEGREGIAKAQITGKPYIQEVSKDSARQINLAKQDNLFTRGMTTVEKMDAITQDGKKYAQQVEDILQGGQPLGSNPNNPLDEFLKKAYKLEPTGPLKNVSNYTSQYNETKNDLMAYLNDLNPKDTVEFWKSKGEMYQIYDNAKANFMAKSGTYNGAKQAFNDFYHSMNEYLVQKTPNAPGEFMDLMEKTHDLFQMGKNVGEWADVNGVKEPVSAYLSKTFTRIFTRALFYGSVGAGIAVFLRKPLSDYLKSLGQ